MDATKLLVRPAIAVSPEDLPLLQAYCWHVDNNGYVARNLKTPDGKKTKEYLHRELMGLSKGDARVVDHIDGNKLNNQRSNLRVCTDQQNACNRAIQVNNTSGFKGVFCHKDTKRKKRWQALIQVNGRRRSLGYHLTAEAAHEAYCKAAGALHGEFARTA